MPGWSTTTSSPRAWWRFITRCRRTIRFAASCSIPWSARSGLRSSFLLKGEGLSPAGDAASYGMLALIGLEKIRPLKLSEIDALHLCANTYVRHIAEFEKVSQAEQRHVMASRFQLGKYLVWRWKQELAAHPPRLPSLADARAYFETLDEASEKMYDGHGNWNRTPSGSVPRYPLRNSSRRALGYLAIVRAGDEHAGRYRERAVSALEYLLTRQGKNGVFPYPNPGLTNAKYGEMMRRAQAADPESVKGDWLFYFPAAVNDGGLNYDNGLAGVAMLEGYALTGDKRYLNSAIRSADWTLGEPPVRNVNYNSFSIWLLARAFTATGDQKYLSKALDLNAKAVLPAQLENGEWRDAHNSILVYHAIITRGLLTLLDALPSALPARAEIERRTRLALNRLAERIHSLDVRSQGPRLNADSIDCLLLGSLVFGTQPDWDHAVAVLWAERDLPENESLAPDVLQEGMPGVGRLAEYQVTRRHPDRIELKAFQNR